MATLGPLTTRGRGPEGAGTLPPRASRATEDCARAGAGCANQAALPSRGGAGPEAEVRHPCPTLRGAAEFGDAFGCRGDPLGRVSRA